MYVRLVVTFCSSEKVIKPKEAHIDYAIPVDGTLPLEMYNMAITNILNNCMTLLNKKYDKIAEMVPSYLKNKNFDIIIHGNYLRGVDWNHEHQEWTVPEPIFNIQQLGLPEENRPLIKSV